MDKQGPNISIKATDMLFIDQMYNKLQLDGVYDAGTTSGSKESEDFHIYFRTHHIGNTFIADFFIINYKAGSFRIQISDGFTLKTKFEKSVYSKLEGEMQSYEFKDKSENHKSYITTFAFTPHQMESLCETLLIPCVITWSEECFIDNRFADAIYLKHDFGEILRDPIHSDFTIETEDGKTYPVHKLILSIQSDVFKAMVKDDKLEGQKGYVKMTDVSSSEVEPMLEYMYTGCIKDLYKKDCRRLLILADKYDIPGLRALAIDCLCKQMNPESVIDIYCVGDMCNSTSLKRAAEEFMKLHPEVLDTEVWENLEDPRLCKAIFNLFKESQH